ncbi:TonB-dependent siderophore receptor [Asticcacaulis sp. AND118]|uniref:TonB-dependent receptor plug domain-containing protein n=1 Tax=Asticcacaulis sp. AND118 TaxID=2840468 RepID=UPI001CFFD794|nr:TonB-dependent receptor [Asticcacaulis sp. AND118]UDF05127.1 TonB-dependent receptor [Asticcacaulis sp. AND118]
MKTNIPGKYRLNTALSSAALMVAALGSLPAAAQTTTSDPTPAKAEEAPTETIQEVVVTGSRLRRSEFTATSPIQVITTEKAELEGQVDTTRILQSSTIAASASQIDNGYTGYNVTGGPGVNTLSLRGLGANRTLILINGHRVGPAGSRGQVGPVDLNTIPNSIVDRYEILKDGASAIYGSDAIAGVVNVITKKTSSGGSFKAFAALPEQGGGESYSTSLSQSINAGNFHGIFNLDYYKQEALRYSDRDFLSCPEQRIFYTDGTRADVIDPATGSYKCYGLTAGVLYNGNYYVYDATQSNGLKRVIYTGSTPEESRNSRATAPYMDSRWASKTAISPVTRRSVNFTGDYRFDNGTEVYGDFMYNRRVSRQENWRQLFPTVSASNPYNVLKTSAYSIIMIPTNADQDTRYTRALIGVRGDLPELGFLKGWTYDVAAQVSNNNSTYGGDFVYNDRVNATVGATLCNTALLITATACPTGGVNYFRQSTVETGQFTAEESAFLFGYEEGHTTYRQSYVEASASGDLFDLPAGTVAASVGVMLRKEYINDQPGPNASISNYWGSTVAGQTTGRDSINEVYAEFGVPVVKDLPFAKRVDIALSTRYSDYESYGSNTTYKGSLNWTVTDSVRLRGSQGTSFRAPSLYEQYLGNQVGYSAQSAVDPCVNYGTSNTISETVKTNCAALGLSSTYAGLGSSATVYTGGGRAAGLQPETSDNRTVGLVLTPSFTHLNLAIDFFETQINNQITTYGAYNIVYECLNSANMSSPFCSLFTRDTTSGSSTFGSVRTIQNSYVNVAEQFMRGFDLTVGYNRTFPFGKLSVSSQHSFVRKWTYQLKNATTPTNYLGYVGYPEYVGNLTAVLQRGSYSFTYSGTFVGETSDFDYYKKNCYTGTLLGVANQNYCYDMNTEFYANHTLSVRKAFEGWTLTASVRNLLNEDPPAISNYGAARFGNAALTSQYDLLGRTFTLQVERKW